jgi:nucleotide-binding universal stress UspA family protein
MKKLLVVFGGTSYSSSLAEFAMRLAKTSRSLVHGLFVCPSMIPVVQYPFPGDLPLAGADWVVTDDQIYQNQKLIEANIQVLKDSCAEENVACVINPDIDITLDELIEHSAFADLIVCQANEDFGASSIRELLADTHCPVLLVPRQPDLPTRAVLCYDESFSSMLAIKMYSYLFPEWQHLPSTLLTINPKGDDGLRYDDYLVDWLPQHFINLQKQILHGNLQKELVGFIRKSSEPAIVVMGAYGRSAMSRLFNQSLSNVVIEETNTCVFIMHE